MEYFIDVHGDKQPRGHAADDADQSGDKSDADIGEGDGGGGGAQALENADFLEMIEHHHDHGRDDVEGGHEHDEQHDEDQQRLGALIGVEVITVDLVPG